MISSPKTRTERSPDTTRRRILEAAFEAIYRNGFQGMRLDDVVVSSGLTKGALYHHFPNKQALGYAVVDEIIAEMVVSMWLEPLREINDPLTILINKVETLGDAAGDQLTTLGCPLNNLMQEMSALDEGFRTRLDRVYQRWHSGVKKALQQAKKCGQLREDVDCGTAATLIIATLEGCIGISKNARSVSRLNECSSALAGYLKTLHCAF